MKIKILSLAILFFLSVSSFAQSLGVGVKVGADLNKIDGSSFKEEFSFGYQIGGFADIGITKKWGIQPEILFSQVNIDTTSNFSDVYDFKDISKIKLTYLRIPLLLNYKPNSFVTLQVGPQFGILMNQNISLVSNGRDAFKKGSFSMVGGLQITILKLMLYGRYGIGLSELNDIDEREKWKGQTVQLGVGWRF